MSEPLKLPELVCVCAICDGKGHYEQTYTAGCGGGYYRSMGPCDYCGEIGLRFKDGKKVSTSVIAQIRTMNPDWKPA